MAALWIMAAASAVSALAGGQAQKNAIKTQQKAAISKLKSDARQARTDRYKMGAETTGANIVQAATSGFTLEGSTAAILEGNIERTNRDINMINANLATGIGDIRRGSEAQINAVNLGTLTSLVNTGANTYMGYDKRPNKLVQTNAPTKSITGSLVS